MNYKSVMSSAAVDDSRETIYPKYKELEEGTILVDGAVYTGKYEGEGDYGPFVTYYFDCGENKVGLNAAGNLSWLIETKAQLQANVSGGIRIVYLGKQPMVKGPRKGTLTHTFDLLIAEAE